LLVGRGGGATGAAMGTGEEPVQGHKDEHHPSAVRSCSDGDPEACPQERGGALEGALAAGRSLSIADVRSQGRCGYVRGGDPETAAARDAGFDRQRADQARRVRQRDVGAGLRLRPGAQDQAALRAAAEQARAAAARRTRAPRDHLGRRSPAGRPIGSPRATAGSRSDTRSTCSARSSSAPSRAARSRPTPRGPSASRHGRGGPR
jgi:hypothetical protein